MSPGSSRWTALHAAMEDPDAGGGEALAEVVGEYAALKDVHI